jgi:hypothetical protein
MMKQAQGWNQVIKFDSFREPAALPPEKKAEHTVCSFTNEFIDIFNSEPLATRLACVAKLAGMVAGLTTLAVMASYRKIPYVEPTQLEQEVDGVRLPLYYLTDDKPE